MLLRSFVRSVIEGLEITDHQPGSPGGLVLSTELLEAADLDVLEQVRVLPQTGDGAPLTTVLLAHSGRSVIARGAVAAQLPIGTVVSVTAFCDLDREEVADHRARLVQIGDNRPIAIIDLGVADEVEE